MISPKQALVLAQITVVSKIRVYLNSKYFFFQIKLCETTFVSVKSEPVEVKEECTEEEKGVYH